MSNQLQKVFGQVNNLNAFDAIRVSISSPERIRSWSFGEVKKLCQVLTSKLPNWKTDTHLNHPDKEREQ